ncbi:hypothetical protein BAUCODRAFT_239337 [Baudoinia panamericana UAMH 10762]|uniref:Carboxylesterase type B domain-containing protein n=1 Tax=Baudoinia panamericana (strain UAMH 10762) TaxID=717646 RepID=M2N3V9_BAUPA|nr:uncharacterized protein BAUCODRAFT_239337 [Baudoinia panamericana UAMH 10762]EMC93400.1 hypothetical protein BAUCODRAFT_239337 [Baudoinia panamericana UAMH 10762]
MKTTALFRHPLLGQLKGRTLNDSFLQFTNVPYGSISQRFGRAKLITALPKTSEGQPYDAADIPPASIQPLKAAEIDCKGNQFPSDVLQDYEEPQSEDCLRLNIAIPSSTTQGSSLPVLVFLHGGAFFLGSGTRPYYNPTNFCEQALQAGLPHVFVSVNYRLGALGFFHSPSASNLMPENSGLHDQLVAFTWISRYIAGFGGDPNNVVAMGQSAGGMSVTIHNMSGKENLWRRSIQFSGSLVTMPVKSPSEHQENFISQAKKLGIATKERTSDAIARNMISAPVDKIRNLEYVGMACSQSELLPYETASMALMRRRAPPSPNLQSQIVSSTTYDGGISYNLMLGNKERKTHAKVFIDIAESVLKHPREVLDLYDIKPSDDDKTALRKICQFESDIGFFAASLAQAQGFPGKTYLMIFDLGNPFDGPLPPRECATHTWDVVALLGAYEGRVDDQYRSVITESRGKILAYAVAGKEPWPAWTPEDGFALWVGNDGVRVVRKDDYMGTGTQRGRLLKYAEKEAGEDGCDVLWNDVCRRFLMAGR